MMRKKSVICFLTAAVAAAALLSCANNGGKAGQSGEADPKESPNGSSAPLGFPSSLKLGNLTGGELFGEPAKYLVLKGEGDLYYAYDNMGELCAVFPAYGFYSGFYGEDGIVGNFSMRLMKQMEDHSVFGQLMLHIVDGELIDFIDCFTDKTIEVKSKGLSMGEVGGVLPFDGKYLVLEAYWDASGRIRYGRCVWLDESGNISGEFDPAPFGQIAGAYAGKYVIAFDPAEYFLQDGSFCEKVFSTDGEVLLSGVETAGAAAYMANNTNYECRLFLADYAYTEKDRWYDRELNQMNIPPDDAYDMECIRMHYSMELEDRIVIGDNSVDGYQSLLGIETMAEQQRIYVGIKDGEGNWLFKLFNPALASDSRRRSMW